MGRNATLARAKGSLWVAALMTAAGCGSSSGGAHASAPTTPPTAASSAPSPSPSPSTPSPSPSASIDPGTLPQTHVLPRADDPAFQAGVQDLWRAIVTNDPNAALPFFFPQSAYLQVKAISNPAADYRDRLIAWYRLDIAAAHRLLGSQAASARFVSVSVPTSKAVWIVPGVEYNKGSYYRLFGTRLTYQLGGKTKSFGIFSLISWRGEWYVVHLGPSVRSSARGIVYQPKG